MFDEIKKIFRDKNIAKEGCGCTQEAINEIEKKLGFPLSDSYKWFQLTYDYKEVPNGDILLGVTYPGFSGNLIEQYENDIDMGLLDNDRLCFYIGNEQYFYFDTKELINNEYPIIYSEFGEEEIFANSFSEFLLEWVVKKY